MSKFTDDFTFTRGTGATRINAAGLIVGVDFSSTSNTIGTGAKTFTLAADANVNRDWPVGSAVRVVDQVSANTMEGTVTTYTPSTQALVLDITSVTGSGTFTNWRIGSLEVRRDADGVLREPMRSNLLLNSATLSTQTVTVVSGTVYALSFWGTGQIVTSGANSQTVVGNGAFPNAARREVTFTATTASLTLTVTGSVTFAQVEAGSSSTSYIPTTTVAVTRNADTFTFTPAAIAKFRQGQGALIVEANASDAGTAQRAALRLTGPSGEIRLGKQGVATSGNFTKMAEGGNVQLLGNTSSLKFDGLEYTVPAPTSVRTGLPIGLNLGNTVGPAITHNGGGQFGLTPFSIECLVDEAVTTIDEKGVGIVTLNGSHHNGSRFLIATAVIGTVVLSTDGLSYRRINTTVITQACNEVTSGMVGPTLRNVIVGAAGFIATSDDNGETWVSRTSGTANAVTGATRSTTHFISSVSSASAANNIIRSTDGITWAFANSGLTQSQNDVHANGAQVVTVGNAGTISVSTDNGATWTASPSSGVVTTQNLNGVHYNASANLWVAVGNAGTIITATDPTGTWTLQTSGIAGNLIEVGYFNSLWVVVSTTGGIVLTSPNAVTWTQRNTGLSGSMVGIAASGTRLIITGAIGAFASSEDGLTYTSRTNNNATLNGIAYGAGVYVSVGNAVNGSGYIATIDGAGTVTRRVSGTPSNVNLTNAKYARGAFYATGTGTVLLRSTDGAVYSSLTIGGTGFTLNDIADSGSLMIAVGSGGRYSTSSNGTTFGNSALNGQTTQQLNGIEFANGSFVIVGNAGVILTTTDGATYTLRTSGTTQNLTSVMFSTRDQRWYAAGNAGTLIYSDDNGVTWASVNNAGFGAVTNSTLQTSKLLQQWKSGRNTMALSYKANEVIVGLNGVAVTDSANTIPSITAGVLGESFNGKIKSAKFQPNPLTLAEIEAITGVTR